MYDRMAANSGFYPDIASKRKTRRKPTPPCECAAEASKPAAPHASTQRSPPPGDLDVGAERRRRPPV